MSLGHLEQICSTCVCSGAQSEGTAPTLGKLCSSRWQKLKLSEHISKKIFSLFERERERMFRGRGKGEGTRRLHSEHKAQLELNFMTLGSWPEPISIVQHLTTRATQVPWASTFQPWIASCLPTSHWPMQIPWLTPNSRGREAHSPFVEFAAKAQEKRVVSDWRIKATFKIRWFRKVSRNLLLLLIGCDIIRYGED